MSRVVRIAGRLRAINAHCERIDCLWAFEGATADRQARKHTNETGHGTMLRAEKTVWFGPDEYRASSDPGASDAGEPTE